MKIIKTIQEIREEIKKHRGQGKTVGFVPTMGYLHEGHLSLVNASKKQNDITVMSIFVNPVQFGPNEDFEKYPRDTQSDLKKAETAGVDFVFLPSVSEMYPEGYKTYVSVEGITEVLCGKSRPGHFKGVTTIVTKLFNIVKPTRAYFGQKDAQQVAVIMKMVRDLDMDIEIVSCPIIRESDGLAMSSRNVYLKPEERKAAVILSRALFEAVDLIKNGCRNRDEVIEYLRKRINKEELAQIDYAEAVNAITLEDSALLEGRVLVALAVRFGNTRLIDNVIVEVV
ncbi:MAG: pantoate--beta-alanine ligase [Clostridiaceae bacterium]|nr:pantoate--beta-alanine ligase [Clostridiaceae bacterium]